MRDDDSGLQEKVTAGGILFKLGNLTLITSQAAEGVRGVEEIS